MTQETKHTPTLESVVRTIEAHNTPRKQATAIMNMYAALVMPKQPNETPFRLVAEGLNTATDHADMWDANTMRTHLQALRVEQDRACELHDELVKVCAAIENHCKSGGKLGDGQEIRKQLQTALFKVRGEA